MKNIIDEVRLMTLLSLGFILRIVGGSSRRGDHSSYGLIPAYYQGDVYLKIVPYNPSISITRKYEEDFKEEPKGTLELKTLEQTGIRLSEYHKIGEQTAKNNKREVKAEKHIKHLFLIDLFDDSNERSEPSPDRRLDPSGWVKLDLLKKYLCPQHQWMLKVFEEEALAPQHHEI